VRVCVCVCVCACWSNCMCVSLCLCIHVVLPACSLVSSVCLPVCMPVCTFLCIRRITIKSDFCMDWNTIICLFQSNCTGYKHLCHDLLCIVGCPKRARGPDGAALPVTRSPGPRWTAAERGGCGKGPRRPPPHQVGEEQGFRELRGEGVLRISGQQPRVNDEVIGKMVTVLLIYCCFNLF